jgi:hypothetical protein
MLELAYWIQAAGGYFRILFAQLWYNPEMRWATVTVTDSTGERHSVDVQAESTYDAAHLYLLHCHRTEKAMFPNRPPLPTVESTFEVSCEGKLYQVRGKDLQAWILKQKAELKGAQAFRFSQRPSL